MSMKGRKMKKTLNAFTTTEAAFIVPFMFFVILALLALILMLYDRLKLNGDISEMLEYARAREETGGYCDTGELNNIWETRSSSGYLFCGISEPEIDIDGKRITVTDSINMKTPAGKLCESLVGIFRVSSISKKGDWKKREVMMRRIDAGKELLKKVVK